MTKKLYEILTPNGRKPILNENEKKAVWHGDEDIWYADQEY